MCGLGGGGGDRWVSAGVCAYACACICMYMVMQFYARMEFACMYV